MVSKTTLVFLLACVFQGYNALPTMTGDLQDLLRESEVLLDKVDSYPVQIAELQNAAESEIARTISSSFLSDKGIADLPVVKCALEQVDAIKKIAADANVVVVKCGEETSSVIEELQPQINAIVEKLIPEIKNAEAIITKCIKDNLTSPITAIDCIKTEGADVYPAILKDLQQLKELYDGKLKPILDVTVKCVRGAVSTAFSQFLGVLSDVRTCIANSKN